MVIFSDNVPAGIKMTSLALTHFFNEQSQIVWLLSTNNIQLYIFWSNYWFCASANGFTLTVRLKSIILLGKTLAFFPPQLAIKQLSVRFFIDT